MTAADVEHLLGAPNDVKFVHGEPNWQRHAYGSLRLMLMGQPGDEADKTRLRLKSITVRLDPPLALPVEVGPGFGDEWTSLGREDLVRRLRAAGIDPTFEPDSPDRPEDGDLIVRLGSGGSVWFSSIDGVVKTAAAFAP